jgi:hypothetical protein
MTRRKWTNLGTVVAAAVVITSFDHSIHADQTAAEERAVGRFQLAVSAYAMLHRELERSLPRLEVTDDIYALYQASEALAKSIRGARPDARAGDLFDSEVSNLLQTRIRNALTDGGVEIDDLLEDMLAEVPPGTEPPQVNGRFPWEWGAAVPSCVLNALPDLPEELEYRFARRTLVLVDTHADLVVDIMLGALPPPRPRGILTSASTVCHDLGD